MLFNNNVVVLDPGQLLTKKKVPATTHRATRSTTVPGATAPTKSSAKEPSDRRIFPVRHPLRAHLPRHTPARADALRPRSPPQDRYSEKELMKEFFGIEL